MFNRKSKKRGERPRPSTYENRGALYDWVADRVCEGLWDRIVSKTKVNKMRKERTYNQMEQVRQVQIAC